MIYKYEAKDEGGKTVSGSLEADTEQSAASLVRKMGYYPMRFRSSGHGGAATMEPFGQASSANYSPLTQSTTQYRQPFETRPYGSWFARTFVYPISTGVSAKDLAIFYREFASMMQAGVPITRCLQAIGENHHGLLGVAIRRIKNRIESGDSLSNSFKEFPYLFTDLHQAMVAAAEESGGLDQMLSRISDYLENEFAMREMVKRETFNAKINLVGALFLPPLVIWVTKGWSAYFQQVVEPVMQLAILLIIAYCAVKIAFRSATVRLVYDTIKAFIPWFGGTVRMLALAKFARAFSSLYAAGVLIPRALTVSAQVTGNSYFSEKISRAVSALMNGATMATALGSTGAFPSIFLSMVHTGETTGSLDTMLSKIADFYEDEAKTRLHAVVKAIPVILLLVMGVWVGIEAMKALGGYIGGLNDIMNENG